MTTFTIMVITAFFIGLAIACSLVPHSGSKIITSTALIKGTCDFIQPIKLCLSLNFLYAKMLNRKAKQSRMGELAPTNLMNQNAPLKTVERHFSNK